MANNLYGRIMQPCRMPSFWRTPAEFKHVKAVPLRRPPRRIRGERTCKDIRAAVGKLVERRLRLSGRERTQRLVDQSLPALARDCPFRVFGRNDPDVVLRERDIDQNAALRSVEPSKHKLRERGAMPGGSLDALGREQTPRPREGADDRRQDRHKQLENVDPVR